MAGLPGKSGENALEVTGLSHAYGPDKSALTKVEFSVRRNRFAALLGPNGAGKSTLFGILTGLLSSGTGKVVIGGHDLGRQPGAALASLGVVFQQSTLDLDLTVRQNLTYFAALQGMDGATARRRIGQELERLEMADRADERLRRLNGGHRRRVEIARALLHEPDVLLLDEPTVGLDVATRQGIVDHVHALAESGGIAVLWATHLIDEIQPDDQVILLHKGEVIADRSARELVREGQDDNLLETFNRLTGRHQPEVVAL
ncbi:MAG: ABC transporter ATP-binding protein [Magnetovibrionaceae bacterium]